MAVAGNGININNVRTFFTRSLLIQNVDSMVNYSRKHIQKQIILKTKINLNLNLEGGRIYIGLKKDIFLVFHLIHIVTFVTNIFVKSWIVKGSRV